MKTVSTIIEPKADWQTLEELLNITFEADTTYSVQARNCNCYVALNTQEPINEDYFTIYQNEKFMFVADGTNKVWVKPATKLEKLIVVVS